MPKIEMEHIIIINPEIELPIYINDEFLNKTVEINPIGEMSSLKAGTLIATYPNLYSKYVPNDLIEIGDKEIKMIEFATQTNWKKRPDYRIDELKAEFEKLSSEQRDSVLSIIKEMLEPTPVMTDKKVTDKPKVDTKIKKDFDDL